MKRIEFDLSKSEINRIRNLPTEKAALEICSIYFKKNYHIDEIIFQPSIGVDLKIKMKGRKSWLIIEVKGTRKPDVAWSQLKVSGTESFKNLHAGMLLYRVTNIGTRHVNIFIMKHQRDFLMKKEPRWRVFQGS